MEELSLGSRGCCWGSASAMGRARGGSARHPTSPTVPHRTASLCRDVTHLDRSELAGFSGWIRASGGMAAGGFPSGRHSIMTERTPLFGYVRSKPLIPHEWPAHTRTSAAVPTRMGLCRRTLSADQIEAVEEDAMT